MKKNVFKLMIVIMLFCCFTVGCKKEEKPYVQITINEIEEALSENIKDVSLEFNNASFAYSTDGHETIRNRYVLYMERQNIDTANLMAVDIINLSGSTSTGIYIFKFSDIESSTNCFRNYDCEDNYKIQQYGNLIVMAHKDYAINIYRVINKIK